MYHGRIGDFDTQYTIKLIKDVALGGKIVILYFDLYKFFRPFLCTILLVLVKAKGLWFIYGSTFREFRTMV